jgi:hypothetical protein
MLRHLWSHCRNINVTATTETIKYVIPVYLDSTVLGKLKGVMVDHGQVIVEFHNIERPLPKKENKNIDLE